MRMGTWYARYDSAVGRGVGLAGRGVGGGLVGSAVGLLVGVVGTVEPAGLFDCGVW